MEGVMGSILQNFAICFLLSLASFIDETLKLI